MANTDSAKKQIRSSSRKASHNLTWEKKVKSLAKSLREDIANKTAKKEDLTAKLVSLQKAVDKAAKEQVLHKNRANRLKSRYALKISAKFSEKAPKHSK